MIQPIQGGAPAGHASGGRSVLPEPGRSGFADELVRAQAAPSLKFSAHAQQRLNERHIEFSEADRARIAASAELAAAKGSREALLLMDRLALVVGVPMRTVITVMEPQGADPAVFTNIDSVVVMPPSGRA